jgi:GNAT superfamily N-acetyltransferase
VSTGKLRKRLRQIAQKNPERIFIPHKIFSVMTHTGKFSKTISTDLSIIEFEMQHQKTFRDLNIAWITKSFVVEESDEMVLSDPQTHILAPGGVILLAKYKDEIVGTCALTNEGHGIYELTKMAVDENLRGLKIGYHLGIATLEKAKLTGAKKVILHSNRKGSAIAIQLYHKLGFVEIPLGNAPWKRADIKMEFVFKD